MKLKEGSHFGSYQILEFLGEGGMGIVYHARHLTTHQIVALKTVKVPDEAVLRSLRREIYALARLRHPGIVRILDQGIENGLPWYAMEFLEGRTLRAWQSSLSSSFQIPTQEQDETYKEESDWWTYSLTSLPVISSAPISPSLSSPDLNGPSPLAENATSWTVVLSLMAQVCNTLAYLHGQGIIHRDLKPDNIFVRFDGWPVLVDFGIATLSREKEVNRERLKIESHVEGTARYMSPEQIQGKSLDARSDLYSLGVILFELLTGQTLFQRGEVMRTLRAHLEETPPSLCSVAPHLPQALDTLIQNLLAKQPEKRLGYAEDVAATLESLSTKKVMIATLPTPRSYLYRPRFAGRGNLLHRLRERVVRWEEGAGGLLLLAGESGVGKTRLALEVGKEVAQRGRKVLLGECEDSTHRSSLNAFRQVMQVFLDRCRANGEGETERLVGKRGPVLARYESSFLTLPGQEKYSPPEELPLQAAQLRLYSYLGESLLAYAEEQPLLLILDDLQWADELSLGFLAFFLREDPLRKRLLVLSTYRSEEVKENLDTLLIQPNKDVIKVGRLEEESVAQMVGDMLALSPPPKLFSRFLSNQSEGNPFFVSEYLRTAVEEGLLWRNPQGKWQIFETKGEEAREGDYERLRLPGSLQALVTRWLSGLSDEARKCLEAAAILGRECSLEILEQMGLKDDRGLSELIARQILEEPTSGRVRFRHDKLRQGALAKIPITYKPHLHQRAAKVLEEILGEKGREGVLGYHWEQAGELHQAQAYYLRGAQAATQSYSHQEAEKLYRAYLSLASSPSLANILVRNELGEKVLEAQGRYEEAMKEHTQAREEARQLGAKEVEGRSLRLLGVLSWRRGHYEEAKSLFEQALTLLKEVGDQHAESRTLGNLASVYQEQGCYEEARYLFEQALHISRTVGDQSVEGITLGNLANLYKEHGRSEKAKHLYEQALTLHRSLGKRGVEGRTLGNLGALHQEQGCYEEARYLFEQALHISRTVGDRRFEGITLGNLANLRKEQGYFEEAQDLFQQALVLSRAVENRRFEGITLGNLAGLYCEKGDHGTARNLFGQALKILHEVGDQRAEGVFLGELADLERRYQGTFEEGEKLCARATQLLTENPLDLVRILCTQGHLALAARKSAQNFLAQAWTLAGQIGAEPKSELRQPLDRLSRAQHAFREQKFTSLFRGELWEDIPVRVQQQLKKSGQVFAKELT